MFLRTFLEFSLGYILLYIILERYLDFSNIDIFMDIVSAKKLRVIISVDVC